MTRPDRRQQAALSSAFAGAIDLSALKQPAPAAGATTAPGAPPSKYAVQVTEATFGEAVSASADVLVVFDLGSTRSALSASLSQILNTVVESGSGAWILAHVEVDTNPRVAQAFGVREVPTVIAVAGGQPVEAYPGTPDEEGVRAWITGLLDELRPRLPGIAAAEAAAGGAEEGAAEPADDVFAVAEEAVMAGDYDAANAEYQRILAVDPGNERAISAMAQVEFLTWVDSLPENSIELADGTPDDVPLQCAAADLLLASGEVESAFDRLIDTVRRTAGDDRAAARDHLVRRFSLFAPDDESVKQARRRLSAALF